MEEGGKLKAREAPVDGARLLEGDLGKAEKEGEETPDREAGDVALEDGVNANHVVDSNWGHDNQWDDQQIEVPEDQIRINKPCLAYGQGYCEAGEYCRFLHIDPEQPSPEVCPTRVFRQLVF
jgi:hypothetical protein